MAEILPVLVFLGFVAVFKVIAVGLNWAYRKGWEDGRKALGNEVLENQREKFRNLHTGGVK